MAPVLKMDTFTIFILTAILVILDLSKGLHGKVRTKNKYIFAHLNLIFNVNEIIKMNTYKMRLSINSAKLQIIRFPN